MDVVVQVTRLPFPGETISGQRLDYVPGGQGRKQGVATARLRADVSIVVCVADDSFGERLCETLQSDGIDTTHLHSVSGPTGVAITNVAAQRNK